MALFVIFLCSSWLLAFAFSCNCRKVGPRRVVHPTIASKCVFLTRLAVTNHIIEIRLSFSNSWLPCVCGVWTAKTRDMSQFCRHKRETFVIFDMKKANVSHFVAFRRPKRETYRDSGATYLKHSTFSTCQKQTYYIL